MNMKKGGIKMIDINMFLNALKGIWIKRIMDDQNNGQWKLAYLEIIKKIRRKTNI